MAAAGAVPTIADSIVSSRLLIMQSKRLMLSSAETRSRFLGGDSLERRSERFRGEIARANSSYRSAVLTWGRATSQEFQLVAYSSLANLGDTLVLELRNTIAGQLPRDQFQMAFEVEMLEGIVEKWRQNARPTPAPALA